MSISYNSYVPLSGLVLSLDSGNPKSYSGSGSTWNDLVSNTQFTSSNYSWANDIEAITIITVIERISSVAGYAEHPINKWNGGTGNASFVLYHFGTTSDSDGLFSFYYTVGSTWTGQVAATLSAGQKAHFVFQWSISSGGQVWSNGIKVGGRSGSGARLGVGGNSSLNVNGPIGSANSKVLHSSFYNRELSDYEIYQHYLSIGKRFNL